MINAKGSRTLGVPAFLTRLFLRSFFVRFAHRVSAFANDPTRIFICRSKIPRKRLENSGQCLPSKLEFGYSRDGIVTLEYLGGGAR